MREAKTYSEVFKRGIAGKVGQGVYTSLSGAGRRNGIRGNGTMTGRLRKYGREDLLPKRMKMETISEIDELKAALADAHMDWCLESAFSDIACERPGMTVAELKNTL